MFKEIFIATGIIIMVTVIGLLFIWLALVYNAQYGEFEYVTSSGESGTASFCAISYGQARCQTNDNTTIMVERFTKK